MINGKTKLMHTQLNAAIFLNIRATALNLSREVKWFLRLHYKINAVLNAKN